MSRHGETVDRQWEEGLPGVISIAVHYHFLSSISSVQRNASSSLKSSESLCLNRRCHLPL